MMSCRAPRLFSLSLLALCVAFVSSSAPAQDTPMVPIKFHPQKELRPDGPALDRFEIYAGYGYFRPFSSDIANYPYQQVYNPNATVSMTGYFSRHFGVQVEGSYFSGPNSDVIANQCKANGFTCLYRDPSYYTAQAGPVMRFQFGRFVPYIHVLGGEDKINGPVFQRLTWGYSATGGGGLDYILPFWHDRIAIRPIEADYHYAHIDNGPLLATGLGGGLGQISALKLSAGLVARFGSMGSAPQPITMACPVSPATIYPGEPVSVTAQALNLIVGHKATYTWTTSGGKITAIDGGANIDTAGLPPGEYTVSGHVTQGRRAMESASCQGQFTIRPYEPPTISCTANPMTVQPGGSSTITSVGVSPSGRQLTYMFTTSAGTIVGTGSTGALSTAGVPPGTVNVSCSLLDDQGKTASASTTVTITAPPPVASLPTTNSLCSVSFERDRGRPVRVDNEAKACLDDIALNLNREPESKLVLVGHYSNDEGTIQAQQRAVNVETYLLEKGVDRSRIDLRAGDPAGRSVESVLVPVGAVYTDAGTEFDATTVHPPTYYSAPARRGVGRRHVTRRRATHRTTTRRRRATRKKK